MNYLCMVILYVVNCFIRYSCILSVPYERSKIVSNGCEITKYFMILTTRVKMFDTWRGGLTQLALPPRRGELRTRTTTNTWWSISRTTILDVMSRNLQYHLDVVTHKSYCHLDV